MIINVPVDCIKSVRIMGVSLQDNLKWNEHVTQIVKKAGKKLYMLRILKKNRLGVRLPSIALQYSPIFNRRNREN